MDTPIGSHGILDCGYSRLQELACGACGACRERAPECLEGPDGCAGEVLYRWPGYGGRGWPRCERHGEQRVRREEQAIERYPYHPPADFDPDDAGESWHEDW